MMQRFFISSLTHFGVSSSFPAVALLCLNYRRNFLRSSICCLLSAARREMRAPRDSSRRRTRSSPSSFPHVTPKQGEKGSSNCHDIFCAMILTTKALHVGTLSACARHHAHWQSGLWAPGIFTEARAGFLSYHMRAKPNSLFMLDDGAYGVVTAPGVDIADVDFA